MNRLREIREDKDLTQQNIADVIGVARSTYAGYELEEYDIPTKLLIKIANYYNVSTDYILYLTDERKPHRRIK